MRNLLLAAVAAFFVSGCSSLNPSDEIIKAQVSQQDKQYEIASQPTLEISGHWNCADPDPANCKIIYNDPNKASAIRPIVVPKGAADVAIEALGVVGGVAKFGIGGYVITRAMREVGEKTYNINNSGDGQLTFANDTHQTSYETLDGTQNITGDTSGDTSGDVVTETSTSTETTEQSYSYADSYNTTTTTDTDSNYIPVGGYMPPR